MPIYEYKCGKCDHVFERLTFAGDDESQIACPQCEAKKAKRQLSCFSMGSSPLSGLTSGPKTDCGSPSGFG